MSPVGAATRATRENPASPPLLLAPFCPGVRGALSPLWLKHKRAELLVMKQWNPELTYLVIPQWNIDQMGQAACFGLTSIWNQLEPSGRGCCCHSPNRYCLHWLQVSDRFCNPCSHWAGACLEGPNHLFKSPPLLLFLQIAVEVNPVRWCKYLLLGSLVSPEMLREEN